MKWQPYHCASIIIFLLSGLLLLEVTADGSGSGVDPDINPDGEYKQHFLYILFADIHPSVIAIYRHQLFVDIHTSLNGYGGHVMNRLFSSERERFGNIHTTLVSHFMSHYQCMCGSLFMS
jgi:hypothetical protein